jgi:hypothetical protein
MLLGGRFALSYAMVLLKACTVHRLIAEWPSPGWPHNYRSPARNLHMNRAGFLGHRRVDIVEFLQGKALGLGVEFRRSRANNNLRVRISKVTVSRLC